MYMEAQEIFSVLLGQDPIALIKLRFWHYKNLKMKRKNDKKF